jgi:hypothetical protein
MGLRFLVVKIIHYIHDKSSCRESAPVKNACQSFTGKYDYQMKLPVKNEQQNGLLFIYLKI